VKCFSEGRESVTDEERSGWPATSRTEENIEKIPESQPNIFTHKHENLWLTLRSMAEQVNIN